MPIEIADQIVDSVRPDSAGLRRWASPITGAALLCLSVVAVFRMESSTPNYDPQYMRVLVERTIKFGGSYYSNGIHNKGPLEPMVYEIAARLGGRAGMWFVVAVFALLAVVVVGLAVATVTVLAGGPKPIAVTMAAVTVAHLTVSEADYAGVLYARNMTVALVAAAFCVAAWNAAWTSRRRRIASTVFVGVAIGLAVQTLVTACFTGIPVLLWAMWTRRRRRIDGLAAWALMPALSAAAFMSAPVYYRIFGPWRDFVDGWWVYARFMSKGTGRSLGSQIGLGWDNVVEYYHQRPVLIIVIQLWVLVSALRWKSLSREGRALRALAGAWFVGGWVELVLSQRYSSHYYSVLAAPTLLIIGILAGESTGVVRSWLDRSTAIRLLPIVGVWVAVQVGGNAPFSDGLTSAATIRSIDEFETRREVTIDGRVRLVRATLDLVSEPGDPLLMWTSYPWPYLNLQRTSATRFIWKSFLMGEIYLGNSGPEYVLPGTWDRFAEDLEQTDPTAYVVEAVNPVAPGTPFERVVAERFQSVFTDDVITLALRNDLAEWLLSPPPGATSAALARDRSDTQIELSRGDCGRFDGRFESALMNVPISFRFGAAGESQPNISVSRSDDGTITTASDVPGFAGFSVVSSGTGNSVDWTLVVGARSAVLVIGGEIVGAVEIDGEGSVTLLGATALSRVVRQSSGDMPTLQGCPIG